MLALLCTATVTVGVICGNRIKQISEKVDALIQTSSGDISREQNKVTLRALQKDWRALAPFLRATVHAREIERIDELLAAAEGALAGDDQALCLSILHRIRSSLEDIWYTVHLPRF